MRSDKKEHACGTDSADQERKADAVIASAFFCPGFDSNLNNTSIVILRAAFFRQSLPVMAGFAERLPVILIPEELLITSMRDDVVDDRRFDVPSFLLALDT